MSRQYTIRNIPEDVDRILRKRAKTSSKSFNQVALEALILGSGESLVPKRDLSEIVGSISKSEADRIEKEIKLQRQIDKELWK